jgi:hypothetical protein
MRVPEEQEAEDVPPPDPDVVLNRRYKSALYWLVAGCGLRVQSLGETEETEGEKH